MDRLRRRRSITVAASLVVPLLLVTVLGHRGVHMVRSLVLPGGGLVDAAPWAAAAFVGATVVSTVAWLRWGTDWVLATVVCAAVVASGAVATTGHHDTVQRAAHEFPLVVLVAGAIGWLGGVLRGAPGVRRFVARRGGRLAGLTDVARLPVIDRCRTVAILGLAGPVDPASAEVVAAPDVVRRVRRVDLVARARRASFPPRVDHAAVQAACLVVGTVDSEVAADDAVRRPLGVPASEPTWVRPLDATLAAAALTRAGRPDAGQRWAHALHHEFSLRRGHRPGWHWTPLGVSATSASAWEHATATAIARAMGWVGDDDWWAVRRRTLAAAARGTADPVNARLIAAGRLWMCFVDDDEAERVLRRPTIAHDPLACSLDLLASTTPTLRPR